MSINRENMRYCTLCQMFNDSVVKFGDCRFQWWNSGPGTTDSNTYADVGNVVKDLCCGLMEMGVEKGDRVAIMSYNCPEWLWSDYAILNAGGIVVTIYPSFSKREMSYIVNNSGSKVIFVRDQGEVEKIVANMDEMTSVQKVIVMDETCPLPDNPLFTRISTVREIGRRYLRKYPYCYEKRWHSVEMWDKSSIVYTSGTTGNPKGAVHTHQSFIAANNVDMRNFAHNDYAFNEDDVCLSFLPLSHTYERQVGQFLATQSGCTIAYCDKPSTVITDIQIFKPTYFMSVPRIFERIYIALRDAASSTPEGKAAFEKAMEIGVKVIDYRADEKGFIDMGFDVDL
ncbi:MAG: AMP-binding protein, partial [Bacillota bacterium]|nr:AMP-binding protein [Bacillota bacterium]